MSGQLGDIYSDFYAAQAAQQAIPSGAPQYPWVQASYPDNYHSHYDAYGRPVYRDRYSRYHYGANTGYRPAPPPPVAPAYGLGDAPSAPPPGAPPDPSVAAAPPPPTTAPTVVSSTPGGTTAVIPAPAGAPGAAVVPFYQKAFHALSLPHPAGSALLAALGAGLGGVLGTHLLPKTGLPYLRGTTALAAGSAVGAGIAGGLATMIIAKKASQQHADQTGAPPSA